MNIFESSPTDTEREAAEELRSRLNVARHIVESRMRLRLSQQQLAERAGTKQSRISELESLRGNVRFDTLDRVSRALGLEVTLQARSGYTAMTESESSTSCMPTHVRHSGYRRLSFAGKQSTASGEQRLAVDVGAVVSVKGISA